MSSTRVVGHLIITKEQPLTIAGLQAVMDAVWNDRKTVTNLQSTFDVRRQWARIVDRLIAHATVQKPLLTVPFYETPWITDEGCPPNTVLFLGQDASTP